MEAERNLSHWLPMGRHRPLRLIFKEQLLNTLILVRHSTNGFKCPRVLALTCVIRACGWAGQTHWRPLRTVHNEAVITMNGVLQRRCNGPRGPVRAYGAGQAFSQKAAGKWQVSSLTVWGSRLSWCLTCVSTWWAGSYLQEYFSTNIKKWLLFHEVGSPMTMKNC